MTEEERLKIAMYMYTRGQREKAAQILYDIYTKTKNKGLKLDSITALITTFDQVKDNDKIIKICDEGIILADSLKNDKAKAYIMGKKAVNIGHIISDCIYHRRNIVLSPGWEGFSLESDKIKYEELSSKISIQESMADKLFHDALDIVEQNNIIQTKGHVLMFKGDYYNNRYLDCKLEYLKIPPFLGLLKWLNIEDYFMYDKPAKEQMNEYFTIYNKCYTESVSIFKSIGDEVNQAYALYNYVNALRLAHCFGKAKKHLAQAKALALTHNEIILLNNIAVMKKMIKSKNRDIPNYIAGEN